jgi:uncharacterized membrane protein
LENGRAKYSVLFISSTLFNRLILIGCDHMLVLVTKGLFLFAAICAFVVIARIFGDLVKNRSIIEKSRQGKL